MSFLLRTHGVKKKKLSAKHIGSKKNKKNNSYKNPHGDPWEKRLIIVKLICTNNYDATPNNQLYLERSDYSNF